MEQAYIKLFIADQAAYDKGVLVGEWVDLSSDDLDADINKIIATKFIDDGNFFIANYDSNLFRVKGYQDIDSLKKLLNVINDLSVDLEIVDTLINLLGDLDKVIKTLWHEKYTVIPVDCPSAYDLGVAAAWMRGLLNDKNTPQVLKDYFNFSKYGLDLLRDGEFTDAGHYYISIFPDENGNFINIY